jgi:hypothetical protein
VSLDICSDFDASPNKPDIYVKINSWNYKDFSRHTDFPIKITHCYYMDFSVDNLQKDNRGPKFAALMGI